MRIVTCLLGLLVAGGALAEPDTFALGTGRSGAAIVDIPDQVINRYTRLTASVAAGSKDLTVASGSGFSAGELVLIHQSTGLLPAPASGAQRAINLNAGTVGRFEYARVEAVLPAMLKLSAPLSNSFPAEGTQVVHVPEYTDLQVRPGASLRAAPWDGSTGGILAVLVSGTLTNEGLVTVEGAGFRGGAFMDHPDIRDCTGFDLPVAAGGTYKGEGLVAGSFGVASGRGNLANAGGGGNCHNTGGGGGGHSGLGGKGGLSFTGDGSRDEGGMGGAPLVYIPYERLVFGGGGGSGEGDDDLGTPGGAGGGVMIIRAGQILGPGRFSAAGATAGNTVGGGDDGAGGGGAGGAISLRAQRSLTCGIAEAPGGAGGNTVHPTIVLGPGGGGGGGIVFLQGEPITCPTSVLAGAPGTSMGSGTSHGAGPASTDGGVSYGFEQTFLVPFKLPDTPVLTQPANGATKVARRPQIAGTAEPGVVIHVFLDGKPYVQLGASNTDGTFTYNVPTDFTSGTHELQAAAEIFGVRSTVSTPNRFDVVETPGDGGTPDGGTPDGGTPDGGSDGALRPVLVVPVEGEGVDSTPLFTGTSGLGVTVSIQVDGSELSQVSLDEDGRFRYETPLEQALPIGTHQVIVSARDEAGKELASSRPTNFEVLPRSKLDVGCGCGASPGAELGTLALLLGALIARRWRRSNQETLPREGHE